MQTLIVLIEFTPLVNFLRNDNSRCCVTKATNTKTAHHERRIYGSRPAGRDTVNIESTDPGRNMLTCCHTDTEVTDQTFYFTQSQCTDTAPTNPSSDPKTPSMSSNVTILFIHLCCCLTNTIPSLPSHLVSTSRGQSNLHLEPPVALVTRQGPQRLAHVAGVIGRVDVEGSHACTIHVVPEGHTARARNDRRPQASNLASKARPWGFDVHVVTCFHTNTQRLRGWDVQVVTCLHRHSEAERLGCHVVLLTHRHLEAERLRCTCSDLLINKHPETKRLGCTCSDLFTHLMASSQKASIVTSSHTNSGTDRLW